MDKKISESIDPHSLKSNKLKALWAIDKLTNTNTDRVSCAQITEFLIEEVGITTSRQAINCGLKLDKKAVHKNKNGYKLMEKGKQQLKAISSKNDQVIIIKSGKPFSAKYSILKDIFNTFQKVLYLSDPYADIKTLDLIFKNVVPEITVKFLTQNIIDKPTGGFMSNLTDLRNEGLNIEVGVYSNSELHDRYFFDDKSFWLSGNSLNNLGMKESFLVLLGEDIRLSMQADFNRRWKVAKKI